MSKVFGHLLLLWGTIEEEKEAVLQELSENNGVGSAVSVVSSLSEQWFLLFRSSFNTTSCFWKKNVLKTLTDEKSKVNEILGEQSDCLNETSNQFLFGEPFQNQFRKRFNAKQNSKALLAGLQKQRAKGN